MFNILVFQPNQPILCLFTDNMLVLFSITANESTSDKNCYLVEKVPGNIEPEPEREN